MPSTTNSSADGLRCNATASRSTPLTACTFKTDPVGSTREYEYHLDGDGLVTVNRPERKMPDGSPELAQVDSEATRIPCD
jgi:hypothetical protein